MSMFAYRPLFVLVGIVRVMEAEVFCHICLNYPALAVNSSEVEEALSLIVGNVIEHWPT